MKLKAPKKHPALSPIIVRMDLDLRLRMKKVIAKLQEHYPKEKWNQNTFVKACIEYAIDYVGKELKD